MRRDGQMSLFTYCLIEALTGHAQPQEGATEVLVSDVMSYVWRHVPQSARADWNAEQTPDYQVSGNFPIALLLGGKGLSKGQPAPDPLEAAPGREPAHAGSTIDTGGGPVVGRDFTNVGTYIAHDHIVLGDQIGGDKVGGDKVFGSKITVRDVVGSTGTAIGPDAQASLRQGLSGAEIAALFSGIYRQIQARPPDPEVDKAEIAETVRRIEEEVKKGEDAAPGKVERWLKTLALMAKDIFDVTVACLAHPVAGIAEVVRKVAAKARAEAGKG
jgi:hypothetical protein